MAGGGTTTTIAQGGVPEWLLPNVKKATGAATDLYESGGLSNVEGLTAEQQDAYRRKLQLGQQGGMLDQLAADSYGATSVFKDAAQGTGLYGANALGNTISGMEDTIGDAQSQVMGNMMGQASMGGGLGSARSDAMTAGAISKTAADMGMAELQAKRMGAAQGANSIIGAGSQIGNQLGAGIAATEGVGSALQQQRQNEADAGYQGIQRLFGLYGAPAVGSQQKKVSSGGSK